MPEMRAGDWSGIENRKHKRVPLQVGIECFGRETVIEARVENISISGLLVRCAEPFPEDTEIAISFAFPGAVHPIRCSARVAHIVPGVFMGLEFIDLPEPFLAEIARFVDAHDPVAKARP